jgi:hypothetical protein
VPVHDPLGSLPLFGALVAYGPAPGVELIPYFLGLVAWAGLAISALLLSPITALIRRIRGKGGAVPPPHPQLLSRGGESEGMTEPPPESAPEASADAGHGQA